MPRMFHQVAKGLVRKAIRATAGSKFARFAFAEAASTALDRSFDVSHNGVRLRFVVPNELTVFRASTFASKEPETLAWIDTFPTGSVLWDIGANVGLYSCYAAKSRASRVLAFEPSVFNVEVLARNIFINDVVDRVTIFSLPLSGGLGVSEMNMTTTAWGGALSTFGERNGNSQSVFRFSAVGLSIDEAVDLLNLPVPDYIKLDVDGIEHLILKGGPKVLRRVRGVLVEIDDADQEQAGSATALLREAGLVLAEKRRWREAELGNQTTFNQIWVRPE